MRARPIWWSLALSLAVVLSGLAVSSGLAGWRPAFTVFLPVIYVLAMFRIEVPDHGAGTAVVWLLSVLLYAGFIYLLLRAARLRRS
jgi:hypothetical protein